MRHGDRNVDEFLDELEKDEAYQSRRALLDAEHERMVEQNRRDSAPVVRELSQEGFDVEFVDDLYDSGVDYIRAIPVLVRWLPRVDNPDVKEGIIRALSVDWAGPSAAPALLKELERSLEASAPRLADLRWAIANALEVVAGDAVLEDLLRLLGDQRLEDETRASLLRSLGNTRSRSAEQVVLRLLGDEDQNPVLVASGLNALARLRCTDARGLIESYLKHPDREVRKEAQRALKALARAQ